MKYSEFSKNIVDWLLEWYGTMMTDDNQVYFTISNMLSYLYAYRVWKRALVREEIAPVANICTMSYNSPYVIKILWPNSERYTPHSMPFDKSDSDVNWKKVFFQVKNTITLSEDVAKVTVRYLKVPTRKTIANADEEIDLPEEYLSILYFLCMRALYPYNLENWASLANNFKTSFVDNMLANYEKLHSLWMSPTSVQRDSVFNWK